METREIINMLYVNMGNLAILCLSITILVFLKNYTTLKTPFKRLFYFLIWNLLIELLARIFTKAGMNNLPLLHIYTLGEFLLFSWFYKSLLIKPAFFRKKYTLIILIGSAFIILYSLFFRELGSYNPLSKTFVQIAIITYAILYFYNIIENHTHSPHIEKSLRLFNSAILIYYSGSLFIFMCSQAIDGFPEWIKIFWTFNAVLNLIFQLLIFLGIWRIVYKKAPSSS